MIYPNPAARGTDHPMPLIDQPWTRVRTPVQIPQEFTPADLQLLPLREFAELLRSNLNPLDQSRSARLAWNRLWETLRADAGLTDRAYDVLEDFLDSTEEALDGDELDDAQRKRATKFVRACQTSWQRLDREDDASPLGWAGKAGQFEPRARIVIAKLVTAIDHHRRTAHDATTVDRPRDDRRLWRAMRKVHLDPRDFPSQDLGDDSTPLEWAGKAGQFDDPRAAIVIAKLIAAIDHHRRAIHDATTDRTRDDGRLWQSMRTVGLDPRDYPGAPGYREPESS